MHENQQPQTEAFELSAAEREAIEHEMHYYEDPRAASIEALNLKCWRYRVLLQVAQLTLACRSWTEQVTCWRWMGRHSVHQRP